MSHANFLLSLLIQLGESQPGSRIRGASGREVELREISDRSHVIFVAVACKHGSYK